MKFIINMNVYEKYMKLTAKEKSNLSKRHHQEIMYFIGEKDNLSLGKYWKNKGGSFWKWLDERGFHEME